VIQQCFTGHADPDESAHFQKNAQGQTPSGICTGLTPEATSYYTAKRSIIGGGPEPPPWGLPQHETRKKRLSSPTFRDTMS